MNDDVKSQALESIFGDHVRGLVLLSKEAVMAMTALRRSLRGDSNWPLPAWIFLSAANYKKADLACNLIYPTIIVREMANQSVISNSFAFDGLNAVVAIFGFH